jgi:hypothetical protein
MNTSRAALAAAIAGALTFSAGAFAQNTQDTPAAPAAQPPEAIRNAPPERMIETPVTPPRGMSATMETPLSESLVGAEVVDASGTAIGEVERVENDHLVVSTGGFLGMGKRSVMLDRNQFTLPPAGSGDTVQVATSLSQDELKAMPEATEPSADNRPDGAPARPDAAPPAAAQPSR